MYQYAVYRGTTATFNPAGTSPLAKVRTPEYRDAVTQTGVTYYYKISALDVAGNESNFGAVSVVTGIANEGGIPTEFSDPELSKSVQPDDRDRLQRAEDRIREACGVRTIG